jgi:hypothetical protein
MLDSEFADWLANAYRTRTGTRLIVAAQRDAISRCRRVERHEGDLDRHYLQDRMNALIVRFEYSTEDAVRCLLPGHAVPISGDLREGTASLKSALMLYRAFRGSRLAAPVQRSTSL